MGLGVCVWVASPLVVEVNNRVCVCKGHAATRLCGLYLWSPVDGGKSGEEHLSMIGPGAHTWYPLFS